MSDKQTVNVQLLGVDVTLSDISLVDGENGENGEGILSCNYACIEEVDDTLMRNEIGIFLNSAIEDAMNKYKEND